MTLDGEPVTGTVYGLVDPRDGGVRYVGQTTLPLAARLAGHLTGRAAANVKAWIRELAEADLKPGIIPIREGVPADELLEMEAAEITKRLADDQPLLNKMATARGRRLLAEQRQRRERDRVQAGWNAAAHGVRAALGGPLPPGVTDYFTFPAEAWQFITACQPSYPALHDELLQTDTSRFNRLTDLAGYVQRQIWEHALPTTTLARQLGDQSFGERLKHRVQVVIDRPWERPEDISKYITLLTWFTVAVSPWWELAKVAGLADDDQPFIAWVSDDPEVRDALEFLSQNCTSLSHLVWRIGEHWRAPRSPDILVSMAAAEAGLPLSEAIVEPIIQTLAKFAADRMLSPTMSALLTRLDPDAPDRVFGSDKTGELDAQLGLPPGTSAKVVRALAADCRYSHDPALQRLAQRCRTDFACRPLPDYAGWVSESAPIVRAAVGTFVAAGYFEMPADVDRETYVDETRAMWSPAHLERYEQARRWRPPADAAA